MILYRCQHLVPMQQPPLDDGGLLVADGRVVQAGRFADLRAESGAEVVDLGEVIVLPGLINAHCHLEYASLRNLCVTPKSFTKWLQRVNAAKRNLSDDDYLAGIRQGSAELLRHGATSILNIESVPELLIRLPDLPQRVWWFYELIDIRLRKHTRESMRGAMRVFDPPENEKTFFGLSPHAPYTASADLYRLAREASEMCDLPMTSHVAESAEELQMFRDGDGPLHSFFGQLKHSPQAAGGSSPFRYLVENQLIHPETLLVHFNELAEADWELVPQFTRGGRLQIAHCPRSHALLGHRTFPYHRLMQTGANICLGTDSLASNERLDLFSEMATFSRAQPGVAAEEILRMVTTNPATFLRLPERLGSFQPGSWADAIAIPNGGPAGRNIYETIINFDRSVTWMLIAGQEIFF